MTFEEFIPAFSAWFTQNQCGVAILTGVRADESLNRFIGLTSQRKLRYADDKPWTTASPEGFYYTMCPLYDWKARDIWIYHARTGNIYNPLYDLMYRAGVPLRNMRVCEPFGPEQRRGLWLYHVLEPETWARMCARVSGASSGAIYANETGAYFALRKRISRPVHHTWRSYALFLLDVMPQKTAEHYRNKIAVYLRWYQTRGFPEDIPDEQDNDQGSRDIPSWRRICKTLHELSPFSREPVDLVLWVKADEVIANDYNPNVMAAGEKKLLQRSLQEDGFTQPVVVSEDKGRYLVVDGFHRQLLGKRDRSR